MSEPTEKNEVKTPEKDSLGIENKKSPWTLFILLQIPIVLIMITILYFMYQNKQNS